MSVETLTTKLRSHLPRIYGRGDDRLLTLILTAWAREFDLGLSAGDHAIGQLYLDSAYGPWLDLWGDLFKVGRRSPDEPDDDYAARIIGETVRQRPQTTALEQIVLASLGIKITVVDLWPFVLRTNQWTQRVGRPLQVTDGQLTAGVGGPYDQVAKTMSARNKPGAFGVWIHAAPPTPFDYTIENIKTLMPYVLFTDDFSATPVYKTDGHLHDQNTQRVTFARQPEGLSVDVTAVMTLIARHKAAGTKAVLMGVIADPAPPILFLDEDGTLSIADGVPHSESYVFEAPNGSKILVWFAGEHAAATVNQHAFGRTTPKTVTSPLGLVATLGANNDGELTVTT